MIWKGMQEGRWGSSKLFKSKEMTSVLEEGFIKIEEMLLWQDGHEVTRKTLVVFASLLEGRVGSINNLIRFMTSSTNGWLREDSCEVVGGCC